jgi:sugar-specific transcriptional regulator TrmB
MDIRNSLEQIGMTRIEANVYLELLKLGESKVHEIKSRLNLPRASVYATLDFLVKKGFASYVIKSGVKYFIAVEPKRILLNIKEKQRGFQEIIPQLEKVKQSIPEKPLVEVYEGKEGLKTVFENLKKDKPKEELIISNTEIFKLLEFYFPHHLDEKRKLGIKTKVLGEKSKEALKLGKELKKQIKGQEIKFLPEDFNLDSRIEVYNDKTIIINEDRDNLIAISIKDKKISNTIRNIFGELWNANS